MQAALLFTLGAWRVTQGIYRFDLTVADELWTTSVTGDLPAEVLLKLPEWCCYIETPGRQYRGRDVFGVFVALDWTANSPPWLRLTIDYGEQLDCATPIPLVGTIEEGIAAWFKEARRQAGLHTSRIADVIEEGIPERFAEQIAPFISMVLYLCSDNADMPPRRPRPKPVKTRRDGMKMFPPSAPTIWECGFRIGGVIRKARQGKGKDRGGTHASPRPHIRKAHWHSFWTGEKATAAKPRTERKLVLRWLPPTPVNVSEELGVVPTIWKVV
jgi:hypothetical protein